MIDNSLRDNPREIEEKITIAVNERKSLER